jgi:hypothetical protein
MYHARMHDEKDLPIIYYLLYCTVIGGGGGVKYD